MIPTSCLRKSATQIFRRRWAVALAIGGLLYIVYLLTFSGLIRADDERILIDTSYDLAFWGNHYFTQTSHLQGEAIGNVEVSQPMLAVPLYWLAYRTAWVGSIHSVFLFNPIIAALTAILIFHYTLDLGYQERTAVAAGLLFGLTTIIWPYAQTFFREPLTALMLISAAFFLERWRRTFGAREPRHWKWLLAGIVVIVFALLSKESALLVLPALAAYAYPGREAIAKHRRQITGIGIGIVVIGSILGLLLFFLREELGLFNSRYRIAHQLSLLFAGLSQSWEGIAGFLVSPGKGIWWYSPVLILALAAPFILPRRRWRESWLPLALTFWFVIIYAAVKGGMWSGGAGWGPRFMVPLTPFLMLAALPLIDRMLSSIRLWPRIALGLLALLGLAIQIGGVYVNIYSYYAQVEAGTRQFVWLGPAIWSFRWSQAFGSLLFIPQAKTDLMWLTPTTDWLAISLLAGGLAVLLALLIWLARTREIASRLSLASMLLIPTLAIILSLFALWRAYDDPRYQSNIPELNEMCGYLEQNTQRGDTILLSNPTYLPYFLNYYKGDAIWYALPSSPGERSSWEQEPEVESDQVEDLISPTSVEVFQQLMAGGSRYQGQPLWLVVDSSPFHPWSTRPPEWYLAKYAYTVGVTEFSPTVRLAQYLPLRAPDAEAVPGSRIDARFGDSIRLLGYDLAADEESVSASGLQPGAMLGLSLVWQTDAPIDVDYTVGVYLLGSDGSVALQQDRPPLGGFALTSQWKPGKPLRDNYGFVLPTDLPPGGYQLVVAIYGWPSLERLPVTDVDGKELGDQVVLETLQVH